MHDGTAKDRRLQEGKEHVQAESQITLGLSADEIAKGEVVDTAAEAQKAADTISQHRHNNYGAYNEVLEGCGGLEWGLT